jgi:hypothetical protein
MTKILKITQLKKFFFDQKYAIFLFLGLQGFEATDNASSSPKKNIQQCKKSNFLTSFLFWGSFCLPGSGSTVPMESGYNPDTDPKQGLKYYPAF